MTGEITVTVQMDLKKLSNRKKKRIEDIMVRQGEVAEKIAELMPSIPMGRWGGSRMDSVFHRWVDKFFPENNGLRSHDANQVAYKVSEMFKSYLERGLRGNKPRFDKEDHSWCRFCNCGDSIVYEQNNGTWGVRLPLEPYKPEWFSVGVGGYQEHYLTKEGSRLGDVEIKKKNGGYVLNQMVTFPLPEETENCSYMGVDLGLNMIAVAVVYGENGNYLDSKFFDGSKVQHYRRRMENLRSKLQEAGEGRKVKELENLTDRYMEHVNHNISKSLVELAKKHDSKIIFENLKGIRERVNEEASKDHRRRLNSWAFGDLQNKTIYKADMAGVSVEKFSPENTSRECPKCGFVSKNNRNGTQFMCLDCGYGNHSDFVGATNLAKKAEAS